METNVLTEAVTEFIDKLISKITTKTKKTKAVAELAKQDESLQGKEWDEVKGTDQCKQCICMCVDAIAEIAGVEVPTEVKTAVKAVASKPSSKPAEPPAEAPTEAPAAAPAEDPAKTPAETPAQTPAKTPAAEETPTKKTYDPTQDYKEYTTKTLADYQSITRANAVTLQRVTASTEEGALAIKQIQELNLAKVIGGPLDACIKAQSDAAKTTLKFIQEVGVTTSANGQQNIVMVTFEYLRGGVRTSMSLPLISLVPIPTMRINEMVYEFKLAIKTDSQSSMVSKSSSVYSQNVNAPAGSGSSQASNLQTAEVNYDSEIKTLNDTIKKLEAEITNLSKQITEAKDDEAKKKPLEEQKKEKTEEKAAKDAELKKTTEAKANAEETNKKKAEAEASKKQAEDQQKTKENVATQTTFNVGFSSKRDSIAAQSSKYSVESSMDVKVKVGPDDMPAGVIRMLEILNSAVDTFDPTGTLTVDKTSVTLLNGMAIISADYRDKQGVYNPKLISCECLTDSSITPKYLINKQYSQILFTKPGTYAIKAEDCSSIVTVADELKFDSEVKNDDSEVAAE